MAAPSATAPLLPLLLPCFLLLLLLGGGGGGGAPGLAQALRCGPSGVVSLLGPCISYARGHGSLTPACCGRVKELAVAARIAADHRAACKCIKKTVTAMAAGRKFNGLVSGIPVRCRVSFPFAFSSSTDCSKVKSR